MASVYSHVVSGILFGFNLTKLFSICNFSGGKDSGKVVIIVLYYYFYNYYYYYYYYYSRTYIKWSPKKPKSQNIVTIGCFGCLENFVGFYLVRVNRDIVVKNFLLLILLMVLKDHSDLN